MTSGVIEQSTRPASCWLILLAVVLTTVRLMQADPLGSANDRSRWCTVWSLAERGTFQIDEIKQRPGWDSIDVVKHEGHFYSTKPPLYPLLVSWVYRGVRSLTGWTLDNHLEQVVRLLLFLINIVPMGVAWVLFSRLLGRYMCSLSAHATVLIALLFGTLLSPFLIVFNNHTPAATAVMFVLVATIPILLEGRTSPWLFANSGFWAGWAVCHELPAAALGASLCLWLLRTDARRTLLWFAPAAAVPLAAFLWTNYEVTGGLKPFYAYYGTEKYRYIHEGIPSYWLNPKGLDKATDSLGTYLFHCTFGHHGIFSLSPVFLLTVCAFWRPRDTAVDSATACPNSPRPAAARLRPILLWGAALSLIVFGFYLSKPAHYNYGGLTVALRWMLWLVPFWILALAVVLDRWAECAWTRRATMVLLGVSIFSAWHPLHSPWGAPWTYQCLERWGWINYSDPRPQFAAPRTSWISALPTGQTADTTYWIEFESATADGQTKLITLKDMGPDERGHRRVSVREQQPASPERSQLLTLDPAKFAAGQPVEQWLLEVAAEDAAQDALTTEELRAWAVEFLSGFPPQYPPGTPGAPGKSPRPYASTTIRHVRTRLRRNAYKVHNAWGSQSIYVGPKTWRLVRRDVAYCDSLPFGVLQWTEEVKDHQTGAVIAREHWTPRAVGSQPSAVGSQPQVSGL